MSGVWLCATSREPIPDSAVKGHRPLTVEIEKHLPTWSLRIKAPAANTICHKLKIGASSVSVEPARHNAYILLIATFGRYRTLILLDRLTARLSVSVSIVQDRHHSGDT